MGTLEIIYKCVVIISGIVLLAATMIHIAKKKMDVGIGTSWTIMSVIVIVFGIIFNFSWIRSVSLGNIILIYIFASALVIALYLYGLRITELKKKSNDVAIWVSIIRKDTYKFRGKDVRSEDQNGENAPEPVSTSAKGE